MTKKTKAKAQKAANLLCVNLTDGVFNSIIKKENLKNPYKLWQMFKSVYALDSILAIYEVWAKWEDTQFNNDMAAYIIGIEECLAKFDSLEMIVPDFVICCSIISQITKKQPFLMQSLFGDLNSLSKPKFVINLLGEVGCFERTNKQKAPETGISGTTTTALATNVPNKKKKLYMPITCTGDKHNTGESLTENNIWPSFSYLLSTNEPQTQSTILDSGASNCMLTSLGYFKQTSPVCIGIATGSGSGKLVAT
ncbi:hypothetical protein PTTG_30086, partial [Puccinia triticina 1-1 BBBD Race 1]